jgi:imidazolonepropionase-like amidohydrolase
MKFKILVAATMALSPVVTWAQAAPEVTVLKAARLFDGKSDSAVGNGVVIVEGTRIKAVGASLPVPAGATVIDLGDATLLPGFIDAHVHLSQESGDNWYADTVNGMRQPVAEQAIRATE